MNIEMFQETKEGAISFINEVRIVKNILLLTFFLIIGCDKSQVIYREYFHCSQECIDSAISHIYYIQDPRTDLCFAYFRETNANINLNKIINSISHVPCELIPPNLLKKGIIDE